MEHHLAFDPGVTFLSSGDMVWGLSYSAVSKRLFVCAEGPCRIVVFYMEPLSNNAGFRYKRLPDVIGIDPEGPYPMFITCSPTEAKAYACMVDGSVMVIDTAADTATPATYIPSLGGPGNMAFSPDGRMSYFPADYTLYAVDETSPAPSAVPIPITGVLPHWVAIMRDGSFAYCGGGPNPDRDAGIARVDLAAQKQKDLVKNLDDVVISFDVTFDDSELLATTDITGRLDVVTISQNAKTSSTAFGTLGQISCSKTAPRACLAAGHYGVVVDTISNNVRGSIPASSTCATTAFDEYGNAYVGTIADGVMAVIYSKINSM